MRPPGRAIKFRTLRRETPRTTIFDHQSYCPHFIAIANPRTLERESDAHYVLWEKESANFTTPVRYIRVGDTVRCFTSVENLWWRNLIGGADLILRLEGRDKRYHATAIENDPEQIKEALKYYLRIFPQDAAYHDIRLKKDKGLVSKDLDRASRNAIVVEAKPIL